VGSAEIRKRASLGKGVRKHETGVMNTGIPDPIRRSRGAGRRAVVIGCPRPLDGVPNLDVDGRGSELRARTIADLDLYRRTPKGRQRREEQERQHRENGEIAVY